MIFSGGLCEKVLDGSKTQTRRPLRGGPCPYVVGKTYAVQPGRGKHAVARLRVLSVTQVAVLPISLKDAIAEGFGSPAEFYVRWAQMYGEADFSGWCWRIEFELVEGAR